MATARARFTLLQGNNFEYLLKGVDTKYAKPMAPVFAQLQTDLDALTKEWTTSAEDETYNYEYFRPIPSALHTGPGY